MKSRIASLLLLILGFCGYASAQTEQHFVISGSASGQPASISSTGFQLTKSVSVAYEFITNPSDSSATRYGSGVANYTVEAGTFLPKSLKSKLLIDPSNYLVTFQAGAGQESISNGVGKPRTHHIVGNFGIYGSKPLSDHTQIGFGYKFLVGPSYQLIKVPVGTINFTF